MRDEMLRELRAKMPALPDIPVQEVRAYYDAHRDDFREPERRRVAHIVVGDEALAKKLVAQARAGDPKKWGELVEKHSLDRPKRPGMQPPPELAGDLGMVALTGTAAKETQKAPEAVRDAAFKIEKIGEVFGQPVRVENRWHIVRLTGKSAARDRSFAEAERTIRVRIVQEKTRKAEADLEKELRKKYPVTVNQAALDQVQVPAPDDKP
jgi:parvulin-like peptidyl-prolyl isomerase